MLSLKLIDIQAQNKREVIGIKLNKEAPQINDLLYVDDLLLFFKADLESCNHLKGLIYEFGKHSGLISNQLKSEMRFSVNTLE